MLRRVLFLILAFPMLALAQAPVDWVTRPSVVGRAWVVADVSSGQILAAEKPDERFEPASLTKLMTAYVVFNALKEKKLALGDQISISEKAWRAPGSRMFIEPRMPVTIDELRGTYGLHDVLCADFPVGTAKVRVRPVPHVGLTVGYRVEAGGSSVAYISDHQAPQDLVDIAPTVLDLCDGVDLVIHDAQYTPLDWETKAHWGHCTVDYAVDVAVRSGAKALALFHHDPSRSDNEIDRLTVLARQRGAAAGLEVFAAAEGLTVTPGEPIAGQLTRRTLVGPMFAQNRTT